MKKSIMFPAFLVLLATLFIAVMPTEAEGAVYEDTVRLHILAESDTRKSQNLKLVVRDAVLSEFSEELGKKSSAEEAKAELAALLPKIRAVAEDAVREEGEDCDVNVTLTEEWYEARSYGEITLPGGYYSSLRIILGEGEGQNWWCVMFPPLCLEVASENAPADDGVKKYTDEEFTLISQNGYNAKFKILELISTAFR